MLGSWGLADLCDDAVLLVSELASNVVLHARTPLTLTVSWPPGTGRVRITVHDESTVSPRQRDHDVTAESGRGLQILAAVADASGIVASGSGKDVWFELDCRSGPSLARGRR